MKRIIKSIKNTFSKPERKEVLSNTVSNLFNVLHSEELNLSPSEQSEVIELLRAKQVSFLKSEGERLIEVNRELHNLNRGIFYNINPNANDKD